MWQSNEQKDKELRRQTLHFAKIAGLDPKPFLDWCFDGAGPGSVLGLRGLGTLEDYLEYICFETAPLGVNEVIALFSVPRFLWYRTQKDRKCFSDEDFMNATADDWQQFLEWEGQRTVDMVHNYLERHAERASAHSKNCGLPTTRETTVEDVPVVQESSPNNVSPPGMENGEMDGQHQLETEPEILQCSLVIEQPTFCVQDSNKVDEFGYASSTDANMAAQHSGKIGNITLASTNGECAVAPICVVLKSSSLRTNSAKKNVDCEASMVGLTAVHGLSPNNMRAHCMEKGEVDGQQSTSLLQCDEKVDNGCLDDRVPPDITCNSGAGCLDDRVPPDIRFNGNNGCLDDRVPPDIPSNDDTLSLGVGVSPDIPFNDVGGCLDDGIPPDIAFNSSAACLDDRVPPDISVNLLYPRGTFGVPHENGLMPMAEEEIVFSRTGCVTKEWFSHPFTHLLHCNNPTESSCHCASNESSFFQLDSMAQVAKSGWYGEHVCGWEHVGYKPKTVTLPVVHGFSPNKVSSLGMENGEVDGQPSASSLGQHVGDNILGDRVPPDITHNHCTDMENGEVDGQPPASSLGQHVGNNILGDRVPPDITYNLQHLGRNGCAQPRARYTTTTVDEKIVFFSLSSTDGEHIPVFFPSDTGLLEVEDDPGPLFLKNKGVLEVEDDPVPLQFFQDPQPRVVYGEQSTSAPPTAAVLVVGIGPHSDSFSPVTKWQSDFGITKDLEEETDSRAPTIFVRYGEFPCSIAPGIRVIASSEQQCMLPVAGGNLMEDEIDPGPATNAAHNGEHKLILCSATSTLAVLVGFCVIELLSNNFLQMPSILKHIMF